MAKNYLESIISDAQQVREASFENAKKAILDATGPILRKAYMEGLELEADDETNETETPKKKKAPKDDEEEYEPKEKKSSNEDEDDEESKESKSDDGEDEYEDEDEKSKKEPSEDEGEDEGEDETEHKSKLDGEEEDSSKEAGSENEGDIDIDIDDLDLGEMGETYNLEDEDEDLSSYGESDEIIEIVDDEDDDDFDRAVDDEEFTSKFAGGEDEDEDGDGEDEPVAIVSDEDEDEDEDEYDKAELSRDENESEDDEEKIKHNKEDLEDDEDEFEFDKSKPEDDAEDEDGEEHMYHEVKKAHIVNRKLMAENRNLKLALREASGQIREIALFNVKFGYAYKLLENEYANANRDTKAKILRQFDNAKTISEVKRIYEALGVRAHQFASAKKRPVKNFKAKNALRENQGITSSTNKLIKEQKNENVEENRQQAQFLNEMKRLAGLSHKEEDE